MPSINSDLSGRLGQFAFQQAQEMFSPSRAELEDLPQRPVVVKAEKVNAMVELPLPSIQLAKQDGARIEAHDGSVAALGTRRIDAGLHLRRDALDLAFQPRVR